MSLSFGQLDDPPAAPQVYAGREAVAAVRDNRIQHQAVARTWDS